MAVAATRRLTEQERLLRTIPEASFQIRVIEVAKMYGWLVHHGRPAMRQNGGFSTPIQGGPGFRDLVLARRGRVIFAELKTETGKVTQFQERWLGELNEVAQEVH